MSYRTRLIFEQVFKTGREIEAITFINPTVAAPFPAIQRLFGYLAQNAAAVAAFNDTYALRGIFKTAATTDPTFFTAITAHHVPLILASLSAVAGRDLVPLHAELNVNFRLIDYTPATASPASQNGCGAHTDYGTFSIIFQDGTAGLEMETPGAPGVWVPVPGDATVLLCGWCAVVLSGGKMAAARHRVRRVPGVRRLSAVLFVAPDLDVKMAPAERVEVFSETVNKGLFDVRWFKEVMGKKWRYREGNEKLGAGEDNVIEQDVEVEGLIWK
ncbi:Clavaminate synthase-like protein [Mytilinidion resinicola]|uniref:Clavaminate synthase-like protein n=1 Tax=Mytilinidion resinicola TaxID=574789 RepID=A0A6A6Y4B1_9PEZI|nr:Clavaminate synthase-like protein [Mytilinidion resinicola]KAF2802864.1 Clavaminate synthase-like protein [Mytilinidion resinicola]